MQLKPEELFILSAANIKPQAEELERMNQLILQIKDWDYFTNLAIKRQMGAILYKKLPMLSNSKDIPENVKVQLKQAWLKTLSRSMVLIDHFKKIVLAFQTENIQVIALKGIYLSEWLYQEIGLRQFSDIDLLVKKEDGEKALDTLRELGYKPSESGIIIPESMKVFVAAAHFPPMLQNGVSIEIHTRIHNEFEDYETDINELWKNAVPVMIHGVQAMTLSDTYLLLHLCLHLDKHFKAGKIQFTCLYDITNLLNQYSEDFDWDAFSDICKRFKATDHTYKYLILCNKYFGAKLSDELISLYGPTLQKIDEDLLLKYLVSGGSQNVYSLSIVKKIGRIKDWKDKIIYMQQMIFPPKSFMMQRYHLKSKPQLLIYYPYRIFVGIGWGVRAFLGLFRKL